MRIREGVIAALVATAPAAAFAQSRHGPVTVGGVVVVAPTPLAGAGVDPDKLPQTVESVGAEDFAETGSLAVTDAFGKRIAGASLADVQGNGFTRDLDFRGFKASPLQGTPQGLAVYMDGVRLNEAFGDTVNWDLAPEIAIRRADLFSSNPAFGLNALGGAVELQMKTGADSPGLDGRIEGGSFGRVQGEVEYGASAGPWSVYLAADGGHEDGWRRQSPSTVARGYADLGWRQGRAELHLVGSAAADEFGVVGPTPVDLLRADRRAIYTWPQTTQNHAFMAALNGRLGLAKGWSLQAAAYGRRFVQRHLDGNDGDFEGCGEDEDDPLYGTLCVQSDDFPSDLRPPASAFQVLGAGGAPIACPPAEHHAPCSDTPYGSLDRTRTAATSFGGSLQATGSGRLFGLGNLFAAGASLDASRIRFSADSTLGVIRPDLSVGPDPAIPGTGQAIRTAGAIAYSPVELSARTTYWGLYATDTLDLTPRLSATLSGRLNLARVSTADLTGASPDLNGEHQFDRFNPAAGLSYRVSAALTVYAGYAEANRAPTPLELACSDPERPCLLENALVADPPLKQVVAHSWEAGLRGAAQLRDGRLSWRLSLFQTDNEDDIVALASAIQGRGAYANVPRTRRRGAEASLDYTGRRWSAYLAYSHIDATYRFSGALPSPNSPFADEPGDVLVAPGDHIGGIPADRLKAGAEAQLGRALRVGADLVATGPQRLVGDEAGQDARLGGAWIVGVRAAWDITPRLQLYGRVDNLLDRAYASYGTYFETGALEKLRPSPLPEDADPRSLSPGTPRSVLVGLRVRW